MATKSSIEMDGIDMESTHGLHKDQSRVQIVLCGAHVLSPKGHGATQLPKRFQVDFAQAHARYAPSLEEAPGDFR